MYVLRSAVSQNAANAIYICAMSIKSISVQKEFTY